MHLFTAHLNDERLQEAWFLWALTKFYSRQGLLDSTNLYCEFGNTSHRRDIENKCKDAFVCFSTKPNEWIKHVCKVPGCYEGYITVDGNEKLKRPMCAAPHTKETMTAGLPQIIKCCSNTPIYGNKSAKPSKYCEEHGHLKRRHETNNSNETAPSECTRHVQEEGDHQGHDKSVNAVIEPSLCETETLPVSDSGEDESNLVGCKKNSKITKFYHTSAGMLALIRPCGIVVDLCEMFTCESATQVFLFLLRTFCRSSQDHSYFQRLRYLGYDRTCDLHPYLKKQAVNGSAGANLLLNHVQFLVDQFHCNKHTEQCCMPLDNPNCKYNPKLPRFQEIHGANTESCEQGFFRLNMYKHATKHYDKI